MATTSSLHYSNRVQRYWYKTSLPLLLNGQNDMQLWYLITFLVGWSTSWILSNISINSLWLLFVCLFWFGLKSLWAAALVHLLFSSFMSMQIRSFFPPTSSWMNKSLIRGTMGRKWNLIIQRKLKTLKNRKTITLRQRVVNSTQLSRAPAIIYETVCECNTFSKVVDNWPVKQFLVKQVNQS